MIGFEIGSGVEGAVGYEIKFRDVAGEPMHFFLVQHQQLICHTFQFLQQCIYIGITNLPMEVDEEVKFGTRLPTCGGISIVNHRAGFNARDIDVVLPIILQHIMQSPHSIAQFHQHRSPRQVCVQIPRSLLMGMSVYGRKGMRVGWLLVVGFVPGFVVRVVGLGGEKTESGARAAVSVNDRAIPRRRRRQWHGNARSRRSCNDESRR
mmetsp:Transcript_16915/g.35266  ORF Transcript_16915/g.35266 Transcript_16915/m.35266 type:complete len:207 (-) Transcript_16915:269-889(-)